MTNLKYEYLLKRDVLGISDYSEKILDDELFSKVNIFEIEKAEDFECNGMNNTLVFLNSYCHSSKDLYDTMSYVQNLYKKCHNGMDNLLMIADNISSKNDINDNCTTCVEYTKNIFYYPESKDRLFDIKYEKYADKYSRYIKMFHEFISTARECGNLDIVIYL